MKLQAKVFFILCIYCILGGCSTDTTGEKFFRKSADGENQIPYGGRSECLPFDNYSPPDDCPDE